MGPGDRVGSWWRLSPAWPLLGRQDLSAAWWPVTVHFIAFLLILKVVCFQFWPVDTCILTTESAVHSMITGLRKQLMVDCPESYERANGAGLQGVATGLCEEAL